MKEAHELGEQEVRVADKAGPKTGELETCKHWSRRWCMRANACRYAHPEPPVRQGVPQDLLLILQALARVGALSLSRSQSLSRSHGTLMPEIVENAQGGGRPAVGYAVLCEGRTEWAVALPCGMAALVTPFPVVACRDMVAHSGSQPGMDVHVADKSCQHGPRRVADQGSCDVLVLVIDIGAWYVGAMVGQGAPLGEGCLCCGGLP